MGSRLSSLDNKDLKELSSVLEPSSQKHPSCLLPAAASYLTFNRVDFLCMIIFASQPVWFRERETSSFKTVKKNEI